MQLKLHMITIENLIPKEHFLWKLDAASDLSFVYEETATLYSRKYGRRMVPALIGSVWMPMEKKKKRTGVPARKEIAAEEAADKVTAPK